MKSKIISSDNIYLRELNEEDVTNEYLSWFRDLEVTRFIEAKNLTKKDVTEYIRMGKETKIHYLYGIFCNENDRHIGNLKIGPIDFKYKRSDLVTIIGDREYWGKGLATEAIKLGNKLAFEEYDFRKLTGGMYATNVGSIKCYTSAGWIIEGRLIGHYYNNGKQIDRILVSCFNPKYFDLVNNEYVSK